MKFSLTLLQRAETSTWSGTGGFVTPRRNKQPTEGYTELRTATLATIVIAGMGSGSCGSMLGADIESGPVGMHKVGRPFGAQYARRTGGAWRIEAHGHHIRHQHPGGARGHLHAVGDLLKTDIGTLSRARRIFAQSLNEKLFLGIHQGVVDGRAAKIHSCHDLQR